MSRDVCGRSSTAHVISPSPRALPWPTLLSAAVTSARSSSRTASATTVDRAASRYAGLSVVPQQPVELSDRTVHPDLLDVGRRLVLEADSWTYHAEKSAFVRDMVRYNALVLAGWRVLRFTRDQVMEQPDAVTESLRAARQLG